MSFKNYFMKSEEILLKTFQAVLKDKGGPFKILTSLFKLKYYSSIIFAPILYFCSKM